MKKRFFMTSFRLIMIGALLISSAARALVVWNGVATNAIDDDVNITADSAIGEGVVVRAATVDVNVNVTTDATLTGTVEPGLFLVAEENRTIFVNVDNNLVFTGDSDTTLVVTVSGAGEVRFVMADGKTVSFTASDPSTVEGTKVFVDMGPVVPGSDLSPTLRFERDTAGSDHVYIIVGAKSLISFIAETSVATGGSVEDGKIVFDPANSGSGRMVLNIKDGGGVYVSGNKVTSDTVPNIVLADIDMKTPAGRSAVFVVENPMGSTLNAGLLVLNENTQMTSLLVNPWSEDKPFDGVRYGFVLSTNGAIIVDEDSYFDYVGLANNFCPTPTAIPPIVLAGKSVSQVIKARNASALTVDEFLHVNAVRAQVQLADSSAMVFRSGVDNAGTVNRFAADMSYSFTILPINKTTGQGEIVLDVEGKLNVIGTGITDNRKMEILSWQVDPTGGSVLIYGPETKFPLRTFAQDGAGDYYQYNSACFLINNRMNFQKMNLVHTDKNHNVYEKDDVLSEPTYIGGETFVLDTNSPRPMMAFYDSYFYLHTCVALTGVDLRIPNATLDDTMAGIPMRSAGANNSVFRFFHNGFAYRNGTGRQMILGTQVGSTACDPCCASISRDAHLDIFQDQDTGLTLDHELVFDSVANDATIMPIGTTDISGQAEIHTLYLGHSSNVTIGGTAGGPISLSTNPTLEVQGNYFSFETRGGPESSPELSAITGKGGIFVDSQGVITIGSTYRANVATMVVKSGNGVINLPRTNVFYDNRIGIADWQIDLTDAAQRDIISSTDALSDYTLNWRDVTKDFANWTPYEISLYDPCAVPAVTQANVASLATVYGQVNQFQIKGSRLGSTAHFAVDDGWIRELVFLNGCDSADAPTAVVVLKNQGRVGLNTAHRNRDSIGSQMVMGVNGVTIIADGDGRVDLNEDIIIDNICHILRGPNFNPDPPSNPFDRLQFHSDCCKSLIVKSGGVLDMSSFISENHIIEMGGNMKLLLEPGATVVWGGGTLRITDQAHLETTEVSDIATFDFGTTPTSTDPIRVKFVGSGKLELDEDAVFFIGDNTYVGVETGYCEVDATNLTIDLDDRAQMLIGSRSGVNNSVFQVGNTTERETDVSFTLNLQGVDSRLVIASRGFLGLGVGMIDNFFTRPSDWLIDTLFDVDSIRILVPAGTFDHSRIFNSDDPYASLLAVSELVETYTFDYVGPITADTTQATILGGGNMVLVDSGSGAINPTVQTTDGQLSSRLSVGLFSSKSILDVKTALVNPVNGATLFNFWKTPDFATFTGGFTNASQDEHNLLSLGYVDGGFIVRGLIDEFVGQGGITVPRRNFDYTLGLGAVRVDVGPPTLTAPRAVITAFELP